MSYLLKLSLFFLLFIVIISCRKDKPNSNLPQVIPCYQKFISSYRVLNVDSNIYYNMTISKKIDFAPNGYEIDTLILTNFGNLFNLRTQFNCTYDQVSGLQNALNIGVHDSTYDYYGHRWFLFPLFHDSLGNKMSWLQNDTINIYFHICNIKFYLYEGQPYICKDVLHLAVKQQ